MKTTFWDWVKVVLLLAGLCWAIFFAVVEGLAKFKIWWYVLTH